MHAFVSKKKVIFFTPSLDLENAILAHTWNWIIEICSQVAEVECYPIHLGKIAKELPSNLTLKEIGGGDTFKRIRATKRLLVIFFRTVRNQKKESLVIYHMIKEPGIILGPLFFFARVKQALWYSHWRAGLILKFVCTFVDMIYTPTSNSFPFQKNKKLQVTGHGIDSNTFFYNKEIAKSYQRVYSVGRVARVKRIENLLEIAPKVPKLKSIELVGPVSDLKYFHELQELAQKQNINLVSTGEIPYSRVAKVFQESGIYYFGSPNTLDKAAIQAAMCGSMVISDDRVALESIGMKEIWNLHLDEREIPPLVDQLTILLEIDPNKFLKLQEQIANESRLRHSTSNLISKILQTAG